MKQEVLVEIKQTFVYYKTYQIETDKKLDYDELKDNDELINLVFEENLEPLDAGICNTDWDIIP